MRRILLLLTVVLVTATACGDDGASGPPDIEYGRDMCTECNMIISEVRFAAGYRDANGEASVFDDIGDLLVHGDRKGVLDEVTAWVHDYNSEEWIDAVDAWFVRGDVQTPMASGLVAFDGEAEATAFAEEHDGDVLRWDDVVATAGETHGGSMKSHQPDQEG